MEIAAPAASERRDAALAVADRGIDLANRLGRADIAARLGAARARLARPATVVCVVGEFKQGKSSLINAVLGEVVCPVDDDLATSSVTVVHHADNLEVVVHRREDGEPVVERVDPEVLRDYTTEAGNPDNERAVERVDIGLPNPLLGQGLVFVDTPGVGGLGAGHAAATLAFLPYADALLFVTDASAELSAPELAFLEQARSACRTVVHCLTKVDLYPEWRRIAEIDRGHLTGIGVDADLVPVSSMVRRLAVERRDRDLNVESGVPQLIAVLDRDVLAHTEVAATAALARVVHDDLGALARAVHGEIAVLEDPARATAHEDRLRDLTERIGHLKGPGTQWKVTLGDRITDLSAAATHHLKGEIRTLNRSIDERLEDLRTPDDWQAFARDLQTDVARIVAGVFDVVGRGAEDLRAELVDLLATEDLDLPAFDASSPALAVAEFWRDPELGDRAGVGERVLTGISVLRGASGGVRILSILGRMLPTAAASLLAVNPVMLGLGVAMGGKTVLDARRKRVAQLRQNARMAARQFVDDVQFELGPQLTDTLRQIQRQLRDDLTERVSILLRTYEDLRAQTQAAARQDATERRERAAKLSRVAELLDGVLADAGALA